MARLVDRTEGWPAGLYMAALSLRGRDDAHDFIATFAGDDRNVVDYLTTEVLNGQSPDVHDFLLSTVRAREAQPGALRRGDGPHRVGRVLRRMEDSNSFVIALDDKRAVVPLPPPLPRPPAPRAARRPTRTGRSTAHRRAAELAARARRHLRGDPPHDRGRRRRRGRRDGGRRRGGPSSYMGSHQTIQSWLEALPPRGPPRATRGCAWPAPSPRSASGQLDEVGAVDRAGRPSPAGGPVPRRLPVRRRRPRPVCAACSNWLTGDLSACRESALEAIDAGREAVTVGSVHLHLARCRDLLARGQRGGLERLEVALERCRSATLPAVDGQPPPAPAWWSHRGRLSRDARSGPPDARATSTRPSTGPMQRLHCRAASDWRSTGSTPRRSPRGPACSRAAGRAEDARAALDRALELGAPGKRSGRDDPRPRRSRAGRRGRR